MVDFLNVGLNNFTAWFKPSRCIQVISVSLLLSLFYNAVDH